MKLRTVIVAVLALHLVGSVEAQPVNKVVVQQAQIRNLPTAIRLVGTVEPRLRSVIGSDAEGLVREMPVRQGDLVEQGGVICKLEEGTLRAQFNASKAKLGALQAKLDELSAGTRAEELARLKAEHAEARADFDRWAAERQRMSTLQTQGQANEKELYETEAEYRGAEQRVARTQAMYEMGVNGARPEVIAQARFELAEQQSVVERHERNLANTVIRAPFAGAVVRLHTEVGQWVEWGGAIVELIALDPVLVRVDVPEAAMLYAKAGEPARVMVEAVSEEFAGLIKHVIPQADVSARTFPIQIEVQNPQTRLRSGMTAWATVTSGPVAETVAVPKDAVELRGGVPYVCVVTTGEKGPTAVPTRVTTGADIDDWIAITSGNIAPGATVVTRGNEQVHFPGPVEITNTPPSSDAPKAQKD